MKGQRRVQGKPCFGERRGVVAVVMLALVATTSPAWGRDEGTSDQSIPLPTLSLTLGEALSAAADNNPDIRLHKERVQEAKGRVQTQLGALLPNLSADVRQSRRTQFLGTIGLSPVRTDPFSIFDARISATQNLFSLSLIQRWRASRESLRVTEQESETKRFDTMATVALVYMEGLKARAMVDRKSVV